MIVRNWPLLTQAVEQIILHPETWEQKTWVTAKSECGTAHCVAGWVVHLAGLEFVRDEDDRFTGDVLMDGMYRDPGEVSSDLLGLDRDLEWDLYAPWNGLVDILRTVIAWSLQDGVELPKLITNKYIELAA